jgi:hypothetical protein
MKPDISEFSYGYALTSELVGIYSLSGAPVFPSLYSEGQPGGGYDVKIPYRGIPIFLQFKLGHYMWTRNAREANLLGVPYYRMLLRPLKHSKQHQLLMELEGRDNEVYYAAPEFHTPAKLNSAYLHRKVSERTAFFAPCSIGPLPDGEEHYVVFRPNSTLGYLCSEPKRVERRPAHVIFAERVQERVRSRGTIVDSEFFLRLGDQLLSTYEASFDTVPHEYMSTLRRLRDEREPEQYAHYLSRTLFDCEFLILVDDKRR